MKNYITPTMEIKSFAGENVVTTGSTATIDEWKADLGGKGVNVHTVDWSTLSEVTFIL